MTLKLPYRQVPESPEGSSTHLHIREVTEQAYSLAPPTTSPTPEQQAFESLLQAIIDRTETVNIDVVSGDSTVLVGQFLTNTIDIGDISAAGGGLIVSQSTLLAHELSELTAKQVFGLRNNRQGFDVAHRFGQGAQEFISGFTPGQIVKDFTNGTGTTTTNHSKGSQVVTVTITWQQGNLVKVKH